jgi:DNA-binding response OmpR family regulator
MNDMASHRQSQDCAGVHAQHAIGKVLVVEDDVAIRDTLAEVLRQAGYAVATAENGRVALACLGAGAPDVILLDLVMPVMDGHAFRAQQLLDPDLAGIPIIVISATYDTEADPPRLLPRAWLNKPFDVDELLASMAAVLRDTDVAA